MHKFLLSMLSALALTMGLAAAPSALATTTTLNFDTASDGTPIGGPGGYISTPITTQYQSVGVTATGGTSSVYGAFSPWTANTPPNLAYSLSGWMFFTLNPIITGNVKVVSAYVSALGTNVTISAYDASNTLVGQAVAPANSNNLLVSVTSSGPPIVSVQIYGLGDNYAIDTLTFSTTPDIIPIADAGPNRGGEVGDLIILNGRRSYDPDTPPKPLTYLWSQVSGPTTVTLAGATTVSPSFTPSVPGLYVFSLVVRADISSSLRSTVQVNVRPAPSGCLGCNPFSE